MNTLNLVMAFFLLPESRKSHPAPPRKFALIPSRHCAGCTASWLLPLAGIYLVMALVSQAPATLWILYGQDRFGWSMMVAGLSLAGYGTCHALSQAFAIGPLVARLGERKALLIGLAADAGPGAVVRRHARLGAVRPAAVLRCGRHGVARAAGADGAQGGRRSSGRAARDARQHGQPDRRRGAAGGDSAVCRHARCLARLVGVGRRPVLVVPPLLARSRAGCGAITLPFFHFRKQKPAFCRRSKLTYANPV